MRHLLFFLILFPILWACQTGWFRYRESCYKFEREIKATFIQAIDRCHSYGATLFVANGLDEFDYIMREQAPQNTHTWLGLERRFSDREGLWQEPGMFYGFLPWLVQPYQDAANGWSTVAQCAAHWNPTGFIGKYVYWYPCTYEFYYVCERNLTVLDFYG